MPAVENEQRAREVAKYRQEMATEKRTALAPTNFDTMFNTLSSNVIEFPVVVKADVQGSVEAIVNALHNLSNDDIKVRVLNNCLEDASDVMELLAERCDANLVQIKGNTGLLFKRNFEKPKIELP